MCVHIRLDEGTPGLHGLSLSQQGRRIHEAQGKVKKKNAIFY